MSLEPDAIVGLPLAPPEAVGLNGAQLAAYLDLLKADVARGRMPGAVVLVVRHDRIALFEAVGRLRPDAATAMPLDAIFRIYSMTKPIVSLAALRLMEQGRLHAAEPIARHLPELANMVVGVERRPATRVATVHDLLRHSAGFGYEFFDGPVARLHQEPLANRRDRLDNAGFTLALAALPLYSEPGTRFEYGRATDVLGRVVEVVSGEPLGAHLKRTVFEPLGLRDTGFSVPTEQHHRIAEPHPIDADSGAPVTTWDPRIAPRFESAGGALLSTAADYARFLRLLANGGSLEGVQVVGRKTVEWMTADHLGVLPRAGSVLPVGWGFGLGVAVRTSDGIAVEPGSTGSYGWSGAAGTIFFVDPREAMFGVLLLQAPQQCDRQWALFRQMVYAALM